MAHEQQANQTTSRELPIRPLVLTVAQAAEALQVSEGTVRNLIRAGELKAVHLRGCVRVRPRDLEAYVNQLGEEGA